MRFSKTHARRAPIVSTLAILAAMAGLALAGCSHPANNTSNTAADSSAATSSSPMSSTPSGGN